MAEAPKKGRTKPAPKIDFDLLTAEDKLKVQEEVLTQARAERKLAALEEYKRIALQEARREEGLEEEMISFTLDLAEFADRLVIDGFTYWHGTNYTVPRSTYQLLTEMAYRTHTHQAEIDGKSITRWRGWDDPRIGKKGLGPHGVVNTSQLQRV